MTGQAPRGQLTREQWMARYGDQLGVARHRVPSIVEQFQAGSPLGQGAFGKVHQSSLNPEVAIKSQDGEVFAEQVPPVTAEPDSTEHAHQRLAVLRAQDKASVGREIDIQARLGNELNIMPAIRSVEIVPSAGFNGQSQVYMAMDNLADRGYQTLHALQQLPPEQRVPRTEMIKLQTEKLLNQAWMARAGFEARDVHGNNVMALPPGLPPEPDGSRVKMIDSGLYGKDMDPGYALRVQTEAIEDAYYTLGLGHMGQNFRQLVHDLVANNQLDSAVNLVNDALSDVEVRRESLTKEQLDRNETANEVMRFAGDRLGVEPQAMPFHGLLIGG